MSTFQRYDNHWKNEFLYTAYRFAKRYPKSFRHIRFHSGKLMLNSAVITFENIEHLPLCVNPAYIFTPTKKNCVAYYTKFSPLSNHFLSYFVVEKKKFNCMEQYFMYKKAITFKNFDIAERILQEPNPVNQKRLGRTVKGFDYNVWMIRVKTVLLEGLKAKFSQDHFCHRFLRNTGSKSIVEANDRIYGVGIDLFNPDIWDKTKHRGENLMGRYLESVRDILAETPYDPREGTCQSSTMSYDKAILNFTVGERKDGWVNNFKGKSYVHFKDRHNSHKTFTFTMEEFDEILEKGEEIKRALVKAQKKMNKKKHKDGSQDKKRKQSIYSSDTDESSSGEEEPHQKKKKGKKYKCISSDSDSEDELVIKKGKKKHSTA